MTCFSSLKTLLSGLISLKWKQVYFTYSEIRNNANFAKKHIMEINKVDTLIFDIDGTLWDAIDSYVWIWNEAFRQLYLKRRFTRDDIISFVGQQTDEITAQSISDTPNIDPQKVYNKVFELQEKTMPLLGGKLYDGVKEGLAALSGKYKLFILSNCESFGASQFVDYAQIHPYITDTLTFGETKLPKALNMQLLIARHQLNNPIYVGDTNADSIQTKIAGIPFVFMDYGFGNTDHYDLRFSSFEQFTQYFMNL